VTKLPAGIGTVASGYNLVPVPTHEVPEITVMNRSLLSKRSFHQAPVTLHDPIYFDETPEISGDAVISIVAA
jgi:hypothetical protein